MLALERHRRVLSLLKTQGSIRTTEIARTLGVTEETVRRDFEKLETEGLLLRSHGGAVRLDTQRQEFTARERATQHAPEKRRIAEAAVPRIKPGQTIFFDPSTTALQVAQLMNDQPLTALTNSLHVATALAEKPSVRIVLLGGDLHSSSLSCTGWATEQALDIFRIDAAFISCRGIDIERGLSEPTEEQARLKRRVVERAETVYLLADDSKVGVASSYFFAKNSVVDTWITNRPPEEQILTALASQGVRIDIAD
jgi:DeoR/GlpR family transcriptional regulator of sugar metabolism